MKWLLALMLIAIMWPMIDARLFSIDPYVMKIEPYSGMDPEQFQRFKLNLQLFKRERTKQRLDQALEAARDMALNTRTADSVVQEDLQLVIEDVRRDLIKRIPRT